ncbi:hypothetical protein E6C27_scaffold542G00560 [Cucumis melo var. makuwa]|uniref:Gag/pol protein n=1 Tax=Cucumis melo var. makuwa TaxID=1194695 RepID=A0A5A7V339_CUCMM|nr:hypothetical protein E6C27_scaffold542G00560 [Cucumis melo var. makuwa]
MDAFMIIGQLKVMFQEQVRQESFNTIKALVNCKLAKGKNLKKREQDQGKGKGKVVVKASKVDAPITPKPRPKEPKSPKEGECYDYKKIGRWKMNYPLYLEELKKSNRSVPSTLGFLVIEVNLSTSSPTFGVLDIGCGAHICGNVQGLRSSTTLAKSEVNLRVENGPRVAALSVGTYDLPLPSGLVLELNNCYFRR